MENKQLSKDKILRMASKDGGIRIHPNDWKQDQLRSRLNIFRVRGLLYTTMSNGHICYHLTKEIHLL